MKYTEPKIELLASVQDEIMLSPEALNVIDLWDMLVYEG